MTLGIPHPPVSSNGQAKVKRQRHPWVYKTEYNYLEFKYKVIQWIALVGWIAFCIELKIAI